MTTHRTNKKLKILLANHDLEYMGGTQTWTRQMYDMLSFDHEVAIYSYAANTLMPEAPAYDPNQAYDLALINHWPAFQALRRARIGRRIFTFHGVVPDEEWPPLGADIYVSVSEDAERHIPFHSAVIRNPIDVNRFRPTRPIQPRLERVAFVNNRQGQARSVVEEACDRMGLDLRIVGKETAVSDPETTYNWADCVIGIARTAMEGMACNRNVVCFDYMGGHGRVTLNNVTSLRESNFGGHRETPMWTPAQLIDVLEQYDSGQQLRSYIVENNSPRNVADSYLSLAREFPNPWMNQTAAALLRRGPRELTGPTASRKLATLRRRVLTTPKP